MSVRDFASAGPPAPPALELAGAALFLDLDGTLAAIAARPEDVGPDPRRNRLLAAIQQAAGGRLAVVSGRSLEEVDRILGGAVDCVAAVHGLVVRKGDGASRGLPPHPALGRAGEQLRAFARQDQGLLIEDKGLSVALHYRLAPAYADAAVALVAELARTTGLSRQPGAMVEELRTPGPTKGDSVRAFMAEPPFFGARPIFLGDDHTDEDGFIAVQALGGDGVQVGARGPTAARYRLPDVESALSWLEAARCPA